MCTGSNTDNRKFNKKFNINNFSSWLYVLINKNNDRDTVDLF